MLKAFVVHRMLFCLQHLPLVQVLYFTCSYPQPLSPQSAFAVTHMRKGLNDRSVLPGFSEIGIFKKLMPLKLVRVARSFSLFLETFLFSESAREERGERGHGHRDYIQNGLEQDEALTPVHSATVY